MAIVGSGNDLKIDGIGGGNPPTGKIAIISRSSDPHTDVDHLFAQVIIHRQRVDAMPNCGNMLSDAGVFAIENGLIVATSPVTRVRIHNVNTGAFIEADVQMPNGVVEYEGSAGIDGVPGTAALVMLIFLNAAGTETGKVFPTGSQIDYFDDVPVACIDMAMPAVIIPAEHLGKTGYGLPVELGADKALLTHIESIRLQAGKAMNLGGVNNMVIPRLMLISPTQKGGATNMRCFMSHSCRRALTIIGAIAISNSCILGGTVIRQTVPSVRYGNINIERPSGALNTHLGNEGQNTTTLCASVIRTARKIFSGEVYLP